MWEDILEIDKIIHKKIKSKDKMSFISLGIVVIVVSDSRDVQTDRSGKVLEEKIVQAKHRVVEKFLLKTTLKILKM